MIPKHKQKLTYLQWEDAHASSGWFSDDELQKKIDNEASIIEEVGWIVQENKTEIHLVARRTTWDKVDTQMRNISEYGMYQRIPKTWIKKRKILNVG